MGGVLDVREPVGPHAPAEPARPVAPVAPARLPLAPESLPLPERLLARVVERRRILFAGLAVVYLLGFNAQWRMEPDSALYLTVARNLAEGHGYTYHGQPHRLAYPGLPWMFAGLFKVFGTGSVVPALVVMPLLGLACLALCYRLFLLHAGRSTAVLMTLALGLSRTFYRYNFELLSEIPFLTGVLAFLVGWESVVHRRGDSTNAGADPTRGRHQWYDWLLLFGGLAIAIVTRPTMWALLLATAGALAVWTVERPVRPRRVIVALAALLTAGAAAFGYLRRAGDAGYEHDFIRSLTQRSGDMVRQILTETGPELLQPAASEAMLGVDVGHVDFSHVGLPMLPTIPVAVVPSLLVIGCGLALFRRRPIWGLFVGFTLLMMLVRVVHVRYFLQVLPLLLYGCWLAAAGLYRRLPPRWAAGAFAVVVAGLIGVNATRVVGFVSEQRRVPFLDHYRDGACVPLVRVADQLKAGTSPDAWVLSREKTGRILTNLSGRHVAEPSATIDFHPQWQNLYVLEPMDDLGRQWMAEKQIGVGDPVGAPVPGRRKGATWQLHRAVLVTPGAAPAPAATTTPGATTPGAATAPGVTTAPGSTTTPAPTTAPGTAPAPAPADPQPGASPP